MKIAYNPKTGAALTTAPANNDITFDLKGLNIFVRGEKFKGTDTTYSVFKKHTSASGGGYNGLVPVPSYTTTNIRFLREDGTWKSIDSYQYTQITNQDLDTLTTEGKWYYADGGNVTTNKPSGVGAYELYVGRNAGDYRYQKLITSDGIIWFRYHNASTWTSWVRWYTDANTDYRVKQSASTTTNFRPLILGYNNSTDKSVLANDITNQVYTTTSIYAQPSTGSLWANKFIGKIDWSNIDGKPSCFTPCAHTHSSNQITTLTSYVKATSNSALSTSDSLNIALGKLEYKGDLGITAYNLVNAAYDGDGTIENLKEILKVLEGIKDTETIKGLLGKYLPLAGGTMTLGEGLKFHSDGNYFGTNLDARIISLLDDSATVCDGGLIIDERCTYNGTTTITELLRIRDAEFKWKGQNILHSGNSNIQNGVITINGISITPLTAHQSLANYVTLNTAQTITGIKTFNSNCLQVHGSKNFTTVLLSKNASIDAALRDNVWTIYHGNGSGTDRGISIWSYGTGIYNEVLSISAYNIGSTLANPGSGVNSLCMYGIIRATSTITGSGFIKSNSSNSYVLLGDGGHKLISDFMLKTDELSNNLTTITKSLNVTQAWMDTDITSTNLPANGTYIVQVQVSADDSTGNMYHCYSSGVMSWYKDSTNDTETDEIILHRSGRAYGKTIYLRTVMQSSGVLKLQIGASSNIGQAYTYTFKFKRII